MEIAALDFNPYTFNAISLLIVGLASILYVGNLKEKDGSIRSILAGLTLFTFSMLTMAAANLSYTFVALNPLTDAFSVASMTAMADFVYRYPGMIHTTESRIVRTISYTLTILAMVLALNSTLKVILLGYPESGLPVYFYYLNPITFLMSLILSIMQSIRMQPDRAGGIAGAFKAYLHPTNRPALFMRNMSLSISIGLVQGFVSGLGTFVAFSVVSAAILINVSLLVMLAAIVYASFDFTYQQPSLVIRLAGLSLVSTLAVLGVLGIFLVEMSTRWVVRQNQVVIADTIEAITAGKLDNLEDEVDLVFSYPTDSSQPADLEYEKKPGTATKEILAEAMTPSIVPMWMRYVTTSVLDQKNIFPARKAVGRYGNNPPGSYFEYAVYLVDCNGKTYEIWMKLDDMNEILQIQSIGITIAILFNAFFIVVVFPVFFRNNLIKPLGRLLAGVRRADSGDLIVQVPVTHNDEVGYLTTAFNRMISSLKQELDGRQAAENELRQLNLTLEERVAKRTRELEILYQLTTASNTTGESHELYTLLLERTIAAMQASGGFLLLTAELEDFHSFRLASASRLPAQWRKELDLVTTNSPWVAHVLNQAEPVLISNTAIETHSPDFLLHGDPQAILLSALQGDGRPIGILGILRPIDQTFDLEEIALAVSIINQFGVVVHTDRLRQRLQQTHVLEERQRLSRDLHDSITQSLYGLVTLTEVGLMRAEKLQDHSITDVFEKIGQSTRQAIREMRLFIHQLRPPELEQEGLINALDLRLAAVEGRSDVQARLVSDESIRMPLPVETACYHIAQEALNNSLKHSQASHVTVNLSRTAAGVKMEISDDGIGFDLSDVHQGGLGLENMRSRAREIGAAIEIDSAPGQGTRVTVLVEATA